jgi:hypothetical protein
MPDPCYRTGHVGNYASFPTYGKDMDLTNQTVRHPPNTALPCTNDQVIKRIILDEIHTIGQSEGGTAWEQIILLAPCPIMFVVH